MRSTPFGRRATDETEHGNVVALGESELTLERAFTLTFPVGETVAARRETRVPVPVEVSINLRRPLVQVDAVDDATQFIRTKLANRRGETPPTHVGGDLPRVSLAHGDHLGRQTQAGA